MPAQNKATENELRIGVIGLGAIGPSHIHAINLARGCRLAAVCDIRKAPTTAAAAEHNVAAYTDVVAMARSGNVDAVTVSTPSGYHLDATLAALSCNLHVLIEKPMEISVHRIDRIIDAMRGTNATVAGVFQTRFDPLVRRLKNLVSKGLLGEIYSGGVYVKRYRTQEYYDSGGWRGTWEVDGGGCLMNQGIHDIDLLLWFLGDPDEVIGYTRTTGRVVDVETIATAIVRFRSGAQGLVDATVLAYPEFPSRIEIIGSRGTLAFAHGQLLHIDLIEPTRDEQEAVRELQILSKRHADAENQQANAAAGTAVPRVDMGHTPVVQDFVDAIHHGNAPAVPPAEARKAVAFIEAIYESSDNGGKVVKLAMPE